MRSETFWKIITVDEADLLGWLIDVLEAHSVRYCVIGGQAINAYVDPLVSLDLDLVVAAEHLDGLEALFPEPFVVRRYPFSLNVSLPGSELHVQFQTDARYFAFVDRAKPRTVLGHTLPVAKLEDVLAGKIWTAVNKTRRASKRQKDLADIARILDAYPELRASVPDDVLGRLL